MEKWDKELARIIDHTILTANSTETDIRRVCAEAAAYGFASVVVPPCYVPLAVQETEGWNVPVCSVVAFPFGWESREEKLRQTRQLLSAGAREIDMVMNVAAFCSGRHDVVENEAKDVASLCKGSAVFKLIIETAYLDSRQVGVASALGADAGADFIKTSTGLAPRGANVDDVHRIRSAIGTRVGIKAAGGIRTRSEALSLVRAGATRLGCSTSMRVITLEEAEASAD